MLIDDKDFKTFPLRHTRPPREMPTKANESQSFAMFSPRRGGVALRRADGCRQMLIEANRSEHSGGSVMARFGEKPIKANRFEYSGRMVLVRKTEKPINANKSQPFSLFSAARGTRALRWRMPGGGDRCYAWRRRVPRRGGAPEGGGMSGNAKGCQPMLIFLPAARPFGAAAGDGNLE